MHFLRSTSFLLENTGLSLKGLFLNGKTYLKSSLLAKLSSTFVVGTCLIMSQKYAMTDKSEKQEKVSNIIPNQIKNQNLTQNQGKQNQRQYLNRVQQAKLLLQIWRQSEAQLNSYEKKLQDLQEEFKKTEKKQIWNEKYQQKSLEIEQKLKKCQHIESPFQSVKNSNQFSIQNIYKLNLYFDEMIQCNRSKLELHEIYTEFFQELLNSKNIS